MRLINTYENASIIELFGLSILILIMITIIIWGVFFLAQKQPFKRIKKFFKELEYEVFQDWMDRNKWN